MYNLDTGLKHYFLKSDFSVWKEKSEKETEKLKKKNLQIFRRLSYLNKKASYI